MMYSRNAARQYTSVHNQGQVAAASPARLVQIMFEHILAQLATAQGCMGRIQDNLPLDEVVMKCRAIDKAVRLIGQLDATLDMDKGAQISANLHDLYLYMLDRLTTANATNDTQIVREVTGLVSTIKKGWDQIVRDGR